MNVTITFIAGTGHSMGAGKMIGGISHRGSDALKEAKFVPGTGGWECVDTMIERVDTDVVISFISGEKLTASEKLVRVAVGGVYPDFLSYCSKNSKRREEATTTDFLFFLISKEQNQLFSQLVDYFIKEEGGLSVLVLMLSKCWDAQQKDGKELEDTFNATAWVLGKYSEEKKWWKFKTSPSLAETAVLWFLEKYLKVVPMSGSAASSSALISSADLNQKEIIFLMEVILKSPTLVEIVLKSPVILKRFTELFQTNESLRLLFCLKENFDLSPEIEKHIETYKHFLNEKENLHKPAQERLILLLKRYVGGFFSHPVYKEAVQYIIGSYGQYENKTSAAESVENVLTALSVKIASSEKPPQPDQALAALLYLTRTVFLPDAKQEDAHLTKLSAVGHMASTSASFSERAG